MLHRLARVQPETVAGRLLRLPLRLVPRSAVVTVKTGLNRGMKWVVGSSIHGCWLGIYESEKQHAIERCVQPGMIAFDIGANAGFYTLALSRLVGPRGHVYAFEPLAENVERLARHVRLNQLTNVTICQIAASDRPGLTGFRIAPSNAMGALDASVGDYLVPTTSLDALISSGTVPAPDVVKMDVEGAESSVLEGARDLLGSRGAIWLIALHGAKQFDTCFKILVASGYQVRSLAGVMLTGETDAVDEICAIPGKDKG